MSQRGGDVEFFWVMSSDVIRIGKWSLSHMSQWMDHASFFERDVETKERFMTVIPQGILANKLFVNFCCLLQ